MAAAPQNAAARRSAPLRCPAQPSLVEGVARFHGQSRDGPRDQPHDDRQRSPASGTRGPDREHAMLGADVTVEWKVKEQARDRVMARVLRLLRKHGYPPDR